MNAAALLTELAEHGIELRCSGSRLRYRAPEGAFTDELRARVAADRPRLLALLHPDAPSSAPRNVRERVTWLWRLARGADLSVDDLFGLIDERFAVGPLGPYALSADQATTLAHQIHARSKLALSLSNSTSEEAS